MTKYKVGDMAKGGGVGQIIKSTIPPASLTDKQKRLANEIANEVVKTGLDAIIQYDSGTIDIIVNYGVKHTPSLSNGRFRVFYSSTGDNKIQYLGVGLGHYDGYEIKRGWSKDLDINQIQDVVKKDRDYYNSYKYAKGGGVGVKRYKVYIYYGGGAKDKILYAGTVDEAKKLSMQGEHSEIIDTQTNEIIELYANGGGVGSSFEYTIGGL